MCVCVCVCVCVRELPSQVADLKLLWPNPDIPLVQHPQPLPLSHPISVCLQHRVTVVREKEGDAREEEEEEVVVV